MAAHERLETPGEIAAAGLGFEEVEGVQAVAAVRRGEEHRLVRCPGSEASCHGGGEGIGKDIGHP